MGFQPMDSARPSSVWAFIGSLPPAVHGLNDHPQAGRRYTGRSYSSGPYSRETTRTMDQGTASWDTSANRITPDSRSAQQTHMDDFGNRG